MTLNKGVLYVVATPIGNLGDFTDRAKQVLSEVDVIAAEDTRTTGKLLNYLGLKKTMMPYHEHNETRQLEVIETKLSQGQSIALVSDAGTPLISDPGYPLVNQLLSKDFRVIPIPGPSAIITALSVSGIATDRFTFEGFLPSKATARLSKLKALVNEPRTMVFYESCHRIAACLDDFKKVFENDRKITVCRELTKKFETIASGTTAELCQWVQQSQQQKGEFVLVVSGQSTAVDNDLLSAQPILETLLSYLAPSQAAAATAQITGLKKKPLYQLALSLQEDLQ